MGKINGRMIRKCCIIVDLVRSNKNRIAVQEELAQFNDLLKMLLNIHEEYSQVLDDDEGAGEEDWFDDLDDKVWTFKRKIHNWLRSAAAESRSSKGSQEAVNQDEASHQEAQESLSLPMQGH